ncbi:MAG: heavy metal translocating P-type ATPase [Candidatus Abyssubacteria bacterium]
MDKQKTLSEVEIHVSGMDCPSCAEKVEKLVSALEGVESAELNFVAGKMNVRFAEDTVTLEDIERQVQKLGYQTAKPPRLATDRFFIEGMDCPDESSLIEKKLVGLEGVKEVRFNLVSREAIVSYDRRFISRERLLDAIKDTGMDARMAGEVVGRPAKTKEQTRLLLTAVSGGLIAAGLGLSSLDAPSPVSIAFYLAAIVTGGLHIYRKALYSAKNLSLDMNFLMSVAVIGAAAIGEWLEGATVVFLFSLAQFLEIHSMERARHAIESLMQLAPDNALVKRGGKEVLVPVSEVALNEIFIVRPGEKIPLDGAVVAGLSAVNQAAITGESLPVTKKRGDDVFAGTLNGDGSLEVRATHRADDTTLARIIHMVEEAQAKRAPMQNFVDTFAKYYTPAVIGLAAVVAFVPPLAFGQPFATWFYRGLVLLVISCPCALVISTPVSIVSGLASAARHGVLIKGGIYLEKAGSLKAIAFDKTGTLTLGHPCIKEIIPLNDMPPGDVLGIAAAIESRSEHHLGRSIVEEACRLGIPARKVDSFQSFPGRGARGVVDGRIYYLGSHRLFEEMKLCTPELDKQLEDIEKRMQTVVLVGSEQGPVGIIVMVDAVRKTSREALKLLRKIGVRHMTMITGDNKGTAESIAKQLDIDYKAELLPQDKVDAMQELVREHGAVAMVGDGVNDAPAMAASTIGVAMGSAGTDAALETADIALMADDLLKLPFAICLSRKTLAVIKQNIGLSIAIKLVFLALAIPGLATLWMAVFADMGASLLVIFNGMRLFRVKETLTCPEQ